MRVRVGHPGFAAGGNLGTDDSWRVRAVAGPRLQPPAWNIAAARHLLSRTNLGGTPEEAARFAAMPLGKAVDVLLDEADAAPPPDRPDPLPDHRAPRARHDRELGQLRAWWLGHLLATPAPLREAMTLFWHGHFPTASGKVGVPRALYEQNQTLRRHALGDFRALLGAVTLGPATMMDLDLEDSDRAGPNENFARELLEHFTVGIGHYAEQDVREVACALTGWALDFRRDRPVPTFRAERHDTGCKTVLGQSGRFGVEAVLDLLVRQPATPGTWPAG